MYRKTFNLEVQLLLQLRFSRKFMNHSKRLILSLYFEHTILDNLNHLQRVPFYESHQPQVNFYTK